MARGFESKDVEFQQSEAERSQTPKRLLSPEERDARQRRLTLELALARAESDLTLAKSAAHRQMLQGAVAALREKLRLLAILVAVAVTLAGCDSRDRVDPQAAPAPSKAVTEQNSPSPADKTPRIVVLGDSLTAGLGLRLEDAYPAVLQRRLDSLGLEYHVVNAGISGDTSAGGLSRLDWALEGNVRVLIVALGGNDALRGLPVAQLKSNLARIIERAQSRGVTVVLAGMEAPPNWGDDYTKAFHDVFPALAKQYQLALVPFLLEGVAGIDGLNQRDHIHPTAEGDRIVAETVWKILEPVITSGAGGKGTSGS